MGSALGESAEAARAGSDAGSDAIAGAVSSMGGVAMAILSPLTLYINHKYLPPNMRPGWTSKIFIVWTTMLYGGFAVYTLWSVFGEFRLLMWK